MLGLGQTLLSLFLTLGLGFLGLKEPLRVGLKKTLVSSWWYLRVTRTFGLKELSKIRLRLGLG